MMKTNSVFSSILLVFLMMEEVLGNYSCYTNGNGVFDCLQNEAGRINIIACWQNLQFHLVEPESTADYYCVTAIFILEDDTKLVFSGAFNTSYAEDFCKTQIHIMIKQVLGDDQIGMKVKDYNCTHCHEDRCNENVVQKEKKKRKFRCYETYLESCIKKFPDYNAAGTYDLLSCLSRAEIKQKGECELCTSITYTAENKEKFLLAFCGSETDECLNATSSDEKGHVAGGLTLQSGICIPCKYDLCNDIEKQRLRKNKADGNQDASNDPQKRKLARNEARNQVVSNPTIIITFISLLVCLML